MKTFSTVISILTLLVTNIVAQPALTLKRIVPDSLEVSAYFYIQCKNKVRYDFTRGNFSVREDGVAVDDFELWCPDSPPFCCSSIALVVDRGISMGRSIPSSLDSAKTNAKTLIAAMDGGCDEATMISFHSSAGVEIFMTNDRLLIQNGLDPLNAVGESAVWDAGIAGLNEIISNGTQPCRAIILFTTGNDNNSRATPSDVIALARANKIKIFTLGYGSDVNKTELERIAVETGGVFHANPTNMQLSEIYDEISQPEISTWYECKLWYPKKCSDGLERTVELTFDRLLGCPGAPQTKSMTYRAPIDSLNMYQMRVDAVVAEQAGIVDVPLRLTRPPNVALTGSAITLRFDSSCTRFVDLVTKGALLEGDAVRWEKTSEGVRVDFLSTKVMDRAGVLCTLRFNQAQRPKEYECSLDLSDWSLKLDCRYQSLIPGRITTVGKTLSVKETSARTYSLTQNYPNPFSESTTIELKITDYSLQILDRPNLEETDVRNPQSVILKFYDLFGSEVLDLSDEARMNSSVMIHASQLPGAGMYFYRLSANGISQTKIMVNQ